MSKHTFIDLEELLELEETALASLSTVRNTSLLSRTLNKEPVSHSRRSEFLNLKML
jgi:hypothetical protein